MSIFISFFSGCFLVAKPALGWPSFYRSYTYTPLTHPHIGSLLPEQHLHTSHPSTHRIPSTGATPTHLSPIHTSDPFYRSYTYTPLTHPHIGSLLPELHLHTSHPSTHRLP